MGMSCYGRNHGKLPSCDGCECADYCKDAGDLRPINTTQMECDDLPAPDKPAPIDDKAVVLTELIEAALDNPADWRIVSLKIKHPEWPLSKIAKNANLQSKQAALYRIQRFVRIVPDVFDALLFNRNFNHGRISQMYSKEVPAWDRREKHRKAKMEHPLIPGLLC